MARGQKLWSSLTHAFCWEIRALLDLFARLGVVLLAMKISVLLYPPVVLLYHHPSFFFFFFFLPSNDILTNKLKRALYESKLPQWGILWYCCHSTCLYQISKPNPCFSTTVFIYTSFCKNIFVIYFRCNEKFTCIKACRDLEVFSSGIREIIKFARGRRSKAYFQ